MPRNSRAREWLSILSQGSKADSPQRRLARLLLVQMPRLDLATVSRRMMAIKNSDPVQGPIAISWLLSTMARLAERPRGALSKGSDRHWMLDQAEALMVEAAVMRKLRKGWSQFGVGDPWFVVHPQTKPWLPRYHAEPILRTVK